MNRDEISRIAQECGLTVEQAFYSPAIQKFASRIESLVREECAKQCEEYSRVGLGLNSCAAAIRKSEG